jgi:hypothetical protein
MHLSGHRRWLRSCIRPAMMQSGFSPVNIRLLAAPLRHNNGVPVVRPRCQAEGGLLQYLDVALSCPTFSAPGAVRGPGYEV